ncbi:shikimate kinase [Roseospirillum parvum]|uniref:Shikimate kinase n=1 Tax=Roseospirillum parvum TaxID=83401 RepID=A0A1G8D793_9PROT|nr:shikimate kinase [Roseospirillum parvum]SDH53140.1 shikimate kinase [Roseospirillum parvum]
MSLSAAPSPPATPSAEPRPLPATVVLIGLMGAGKSCIGRHLARRLDVPFVDADREIEEAAGCSVADIFTFYGEAGFRDGERRVMARLLAQPPCILAAGGGAYMDPETRALIAGGAVSLWLKADLDLLVSRTEGRTHRPLLNQGNPRETLRRLMEMRYPVYAECDLAVTTSDEPPGRTTARVLAALEDHFGHPLLTPSPAES